jgi:hypothetical protein
LVSRAVLSAFLRRHGEEGGGLLVQAFTATLRTLDLVLFVFRKGKGDFKWLLAIFAIELIARHVDLRKRQRGGTLFHVYAHGTPVSRQVKRTCSSDIRGSKASGAGGFETYGGGILVVVEGDAAIPGVSGPQRGVSSGWLPMLLLAEG